MTGLWEETNKGTQLCEETDEGVEQGEKTDEGKKLCKCRKTDKRM
jgi:hypothetical protein